MYKTFDMFLTSFALNEPITNKFVPTQSVLPERFTSITEPITHPILSSEALSTSDQSIASEDLLDWRPKLLKKEAFK